MNRRSSIKRLATALTLAFFMLLSVPSVDKHQEAQAQWITFDVANVVSLGKQFYQLRQQFMQIRHSAEMFTRDLQLIGEIVQVDLAPWSDDMDAIFSRIDDFDAGISTAVNFMMEDEDLGIGFNDLLNELYSTARQGSVSDLLSEGLELVEAQSLSQLQRVRDQSVMDTYRETMDMMRQNRLLLEDQQQYMQEALEDITKADGTLGAIQGQSVIQALNTRSIEGLRQQIAAQINMDAVKAQYEQTRDQIENEIAYHRKRGSSMVSRRLAQTAPVPGFAADDFSAIFTGEDD